jgi:hypothetical protein
MRNSCVFLPLMMALGCPCAMPAVSVAALGGMVSSDLEGRMEGVVVSAKRAGSTITVSVVSDNQGRYAFPANKLEAGKYALEVRAVGYELRESVATEVAANKTTRIDLKLTKVQDLAVATEQRRMVDECSGNIRAEGRPFRVYHLSHGRRDSKKHVRCRELADDDRPNAEFCGT